MDTGIYKIGRIERESVLIFNWRNSEYTSSFYNDFIDILLFPV